MPGATFTIEFYEVQSANDIPPNHAPSSGNCLWAIHNQTPAAVPAVGDRVHDTRRMYRVLGRDFLVMDEGHDNFVMLSAWVYVQPIP